MANTSKTTEPKAEARAEPNTAVDELEKIMSEIEELQNELEEPVTPATAPTSSSSASVAATNDTDIDLNNDDILKEIQASGLVDESNMEETLAELKSETTSSSLLSDVSDETTAEITGETYSEKPMSNDGSLTMTLTGNMTLKLKYEYEGQEVVISFADQALRVQLTDGTEFKVPVSRVAQPSNVKSIKKTG